LHFYTKDAKIAGLTKPVIIAPLRCATNQPDKDHRDNEDPGAMLFNGTQQIAAGQKNGTGATRKTA